MPLVARPDGTLASVTRFDGSIVVWTRPGVADAVPFQEDPPIPELTIERAEWGQDLEPGMPYSWSMGGHCSIDQLGQFNDQIWQLEEPVPIPREVIIFGSVYGIIELTDTPDGQVITFTSGDVIVDIYEPRPSAKRRLCY